jgi:hypothetical protein
MKQYRWIVAGGLLGLLILAGVLFFGRTRETAGADLIAIAPSEKRAVLPMDEAFVITDATVGGVNKRAIFTQPESRFKWSLVIPQNGWLKVSLALREDVWTKPGDGVLFRVGIDDGHTYEDISKTVVNPYGNPGDRRWVDLALDLGSYAGETCNLVLSTNASPPGVPVNRDNDLALWGEPRIVIR